MFILLSRLFDQKFTSKNRFCKLLFETRPAYVFKNISRFLPNFSLLFLIDMLLIKICVQQTELMLTKISRVRLLVVSVFRGGLCWLIAATMLILFLSEVINLFPGSSWLEYILSQKN